MNQSMELIKLLIRHFRNEKRTGAEMYPAIVSGIAARKAPVNFALAWFDSYLKSRKQFVQLKIVNHHNVV